MPRSAGALVLTCCDGLEVVMACCPSILKALCARGKTLRTSYFPRDCAKLLQSIAQNNSWGVFSGGDCANLLLLSAFLLFL